MSKFNKLSRAEMKNVSGGNLHACQVVCFTVTDLSTGAGNNSLTFVPDCSPASLANCNFGGSVTSCSCGTF